jgi:hypothetical protein
MTGCSGATAVFACALGLTFLPGLGACSTRRKAAESRGPFLSIQTREAATAARTGVPPESVSLAMGGLPPEALARLREDLTDSADLAVRRAAPGLFDLGDDPPPDPLRQALPDLPALTAAANLRGAPWEAPGISVELVPACGAAAARCAPLFAPAPDPDDVLVRRGRALAWSLASAALLRVPASARPALLRSLREAQTRATGTIALVFGASRGTLDEGELDRLRDQARRVLAHVAPDAPQRPWLDALGAARADWDLPVELGADQVLVVPRLSALARLRDFASEVALAGTFDWVARPGLVGGK